MIYLCVLAVNVGFEHKIMFKLCSKQQFCLGKLTISGKQKARIPYRLLANRLEPINGFEPLTC